jgi:hypothetical protein
VAGPAREVLAVRYGRRVTTRAAGGHDGYAETVTSVPYGRYG